MTEQQLQKRMTAWGADPNDIEVATDDLADRQRRDIQDRELEEAHWHDSTGDEESK